MSRRNRPSAFDVSFPDETVVPGSTSLVERARQAAGVSSGPRASSSSILTSSSSSRSQPHALERRHSSTTLSSPTPSRVHSITSYTEIGSTSTSLEGHTLKRKAGLSVRISSGTETSHVQGVKRSKVATENPSIARLRYTPQDRDIKETATMTIIGEDPEDVDSDDKERKPIRILSDFVLFDPKANLSIISPDALDENPRGLYEAAGYVAPVFVNEEDAGQEDEDEEDVLQRLRTTRVLRFSLDYAISDDPLYIETKFAWYILRQPSKIYKDVFLRFYFPKRVTQMVISAALQNPRLTYEDFQGAYLGLYDDLLGTKLERQLIESAIPTMRSVITSHQQSAKLRNVPCIMKLVGAGLPPLASSSLVPPPRLSQPNGQLFYARKLLGNIDLAVLRPESQNPTHVTALIDRLSEGLFREHLVVVGPPPRRPDRVLLSRLQRQRKMNLLAFLTEDRKTVKRVIFPGSEQLKGAYWKAVNVDGEVYQIGDCIVMRAGAYERRAEPVMPADLSELPDNANAADYFWFGKIIYLDQQKKQVHVHWFEHASKSILQEICNQQELFLSRTCSSVDITLICGKVDVMYGRPAQASAANETFDYFCSLQYSDVDGAFTAIPQNQSQNGSGSEDDCPVCTAAIRADRDDSPQEIKNGFGFRGEKYHLHDYVLIGTPESVCDVGQIVEISWSNSTRNGASDRITVRGLGRVSDIVNIPACPSDILKDERHLYLTDSLLEVSMRQVVRQCSVRHPDSYTTTEFDNYLTSSPYHFHVKYKFPNMKVTSWRSKALLEPRDVTVCKMCTKMFLNRSAQLQDLLSACEKKPLRVFDPFGGVGAFTAGMEAAGCMKTTHAVEISPSAADTLKKNFPDIIVYNQCSNIILRYAIKQHEGHDVEVPRNLQDKSPVADPPQPGSIDCIVAGFPCQPHSRLNMFQRANDRKSHLILNLCAWVDFLRPKYCFFENVRGFLSFNLNATQAGRYRVEGGIEMGGLKWLINTLLEMNYQVRYGLLQAAHYGTPQSRVRFFLIASQYSYPLPSLPTPVYEFPEKDALEIRLAALPRPLAPINSSTKVAHRFISVQDAIGDLPRFDWKHPRRPNQGQRAIEHPDEPGEEFVVPALPCNKDRAFCGYYGPNPMYHSEPKTLFQQKCRQKPLKDLQHYTRVLKEQVVERVVNIPLHAKADYRALKQSDWEWQFSNPSSAVARDGFRPGLYGRLDKDGWFRTTVTNVEPTAKQSWVLNPFCKRVVTVRELARSQGFPDHFVFSSKNNDIKTMHRQIGNAVPWPVSLALGRELRDAMLQKLMDDKANAIVIE